MLLGNNRLTVWNDIFVRPERRQGESSAEFFERIAATRWQQYLATAERQALLAAHRHSDGPSTVLDVGAGVGRWSQVLQGLGWRSVSTEVDEDALAICQRRIPGATCVRVQENDTTLPGADASFGMIICMGVLHVVSTDWFINEASRLLVPGGVFVGVIGNRRSARGLFKRALRSFRGLRGLDHYSTSYPRWKEALRPRGFDLLREEGLCWMPFSQVSNSPLIASDGRAGAPAWPRPRS